MTTTHTNAEELSRWMLDQHWMSPSLRVDVVIDGDVDE